MMHKNTPFPATPSTPNQVNHVTADGLWFDKDLSQPEPIPEEAIERAVTLLRNGRLHRYGEQANASSEASLLEQDYAAYVGSQYCVAVNSCGAAMFVALRALGVKPGDKVLTNTFTLAPVPGAIAHAGADPVLVEIAADYTTDLADLARKARSSGATIFLLSHMRGHIVNLAQVIQLCDSLGITVIEDCAHTMGAKWDGKHTGTWGKVGCYSAQTYKHINAGEGGLLVTNDADIAAQAMLMSGSYMLYGQHILKPATEVFERWQYVTPNFSLRMSNLAAALLRPQIGMLAQRAQRWNHIYDRLQQVLSKLAYIAIPERDSREEFVASSIQFSLNLAPAQITRFVHECEIRGLYLKWFGRSQPLAFTSNYQHWRYIEPAPHAPASMQILAQLLDLRIPLTLSDSDCLLIGDIVNVASTIAANTSTACKDALPKV